MGSEARAVLPVATPGRGRAAATSSLSSTRIGRVVVPVADVDRALVFCGALGVEKAVDVPIGPDMPRSR